MTRINLTVQVNFVAVLLYIPLHLLRQPLITRVRELPELFFSLYIPFKYKLSEYM